jgi:DnaJ-like protein
MPEGTGNPRALARRREIDPYEVLQISPHASPEVITAAYRALARRAHPDINDGRDSTGRMRELNAAYDLLNDPRRRSEHDARTRPVRSQRARSAQATQRLVASRRREDIVLERTPVAPDARSSAVGRVRGPLLAGLTMAAALLLLVVVTAWALNDLAEEHPEVTLSGGGHFSAQMPAEHRIRLPLLTSRETPLELP